MNRKNALPLENSQQDKAPTVCAGFPPWSLSLLSLALSLCQEFGEAAAVLAFVAIMQCGP
jgi:hypothetical protein